MSVVSDLYFARRFQALLKTFEQLASMILDTIRIDLRCRVTHYIDASMRHGDYSVEREAGEPDPHVMDLNAELSDTEHFFSASLSKNEHE
jgi:exocyst complex component 4